MTFIQKKHRETWLDPSQVKSHTKPWHYYPNSPSTINSSYNPLSYACVVFLTPTIPTKGLPLIHFIWGIIRIHLGHVPNAYKYLLKIFFLYFKEVAEKRKKSCGDHLPPQQGLVSFFSVYFSKFFHDLLKVFSSLIPILLCLAILILNVRLH